MHFKSLIFLFFLLFSLQVFSQNGDDILGNWINDKENKIINIYKDNDLYYGKITWLQDTDESKGEKVLDIKNPNASLKQRNVVGINYLLSFAYFSEREVWKEGQIYNFKTGNTYTGKIHLTNKNEMELTGYYGILWFLGRTKTWTRTNK
ncbi:MAG: DUF2147 domain-containing protein [Chitinophagales bacterium]